jgi:hypothetical protein
MRQLTVVEKYSAYGAVLTFLFLAFVWWLLLVNFADNKPQVAFETTIIKQPVIEKPVDPWRMARIEARANGIDSKLVIAVIKSENLLVRPKEFEGACLMVDDLPTCTQTLAKTYKSLTDFLGRKPTPSDLVLAHIFGTNEALRIARITGGVKTDEIGEDILKANPNIKSFASMRNFRIWLNRTVWRRMYQF